MGAARLAKCEAIPRSRGGRHQQVVLGIFAPERSVSHILARRNLAVTAKARGSPAGGRTSDCWANGRAGGARSQLGNPGPFPRAGNYGTTSWGSNACRPDAG